MWLNKDQSLKANARIKDSGKVNDDEDNPSSEQLKKMTKSCIKWHVAETHMSCLLPSNGSSRNFTTSVHSKSFKTSTIYTSPKAVEEHIQDLSKLFIDSSVHFTSMYSKKMSREGKIRGLAMLGQFLKKLQKISFVMGHRGGSDMRDSDDDVEAPTMVADDVKEGHFVVFAVKGEKTRRFVVKLEFLTNSDFLRLLEEAEEEYGYEQKGALEIPCQPEELQKILQHWTEKRMSVRQWFNLSSVTSLL